MLENTHTETLTRSTKREQCRHRGLVCDRLIGFEIIIRVQIRHLLLNEREQRLAQRGVYLLGVPVACTRSKGY